MTTTSDYPKWCGHHPDLLCGCGLFQTTLPVGQDPYKAGEQFTIIDDRDEVRSVSSTGGEKGVKPERFDLIPVEALEALARHYGVGAKKYDDNQWRKGYEWGKSFAAMMRHAWAFWRGEDIDPETGSPHIICVAWHAFGLFTFMQEHPQFDDRYKKEEK